ncbi:MAG: glycosyltransferase family 39 protein [Xanthobacteraceae bacterium]
MLAALLSFRGVVAFWVVYGVAHALLRLSITRTLTLDDSRASELVQTLSLGYQVWQPPLYEWLLWASQQVFGAGIESHLFVRYSLIALLGIATFGAVRAAVKDERWAAAASLSLVFTYPVGWTFHEWATQTILLSIACLATMHAAIRHFERPAVGAVVALGFALALGIYSKFSFPLFVGGLLFAALSIPETRARLADARLLISAAIVIAAISPFAYWVWRVQGALVSELTAYMIASTQTHAVRAAFGLRRLAISIPIFLLPWLLFAALLAPQAFMRPAKDAPAPSMAERLALRTMIFAAALAAAGIALAGATNIAERYMHPILMVAPVYVFARVARLAPGAESVRRFAAFALGAALAIFAVRFIAATDNPLTRKAERGLLQPYAELADAFNARGIVDGTVLSSRVRESGNLRAFLPDLRVVARESYRAERPPRRASDDRSCVVIWAQGEEAETRHFAPIDSLQAERLDVTSRPSPIIAPASRTWFIARLDPKSPACM